jgi:hypothetical protein
MNGGTKMNTEAKLQIVNVITWILAIWLLFTGQWGWAIIVAILGWYLIAGAKKMG